jgi:NifB/MoaA-like Fe-S oxidoreductase
LRVKLLRNRFAGKIVEQIDVLANHGIAMHCQAVIVPGENDGEELKYTARKLFSYYPTVRDLACVPTGLTKYRENLTPIADIDKQYSEKLLDLVDELNAEFGVNFLLPADEYFVKAERERKPVEFYGNFEQVENGVGLTTQFLDEAYTALGRAAYRHFTSEENSADAVAACMQDVERARREVARMKRQIKELRVEESTPAGPAPEKHSDAEVTPTAEESDT